MVKKRFVQIGDYAIDPDGVRWQIVAIREGGNGMPLVDLRATAGGDRALASTDEVLRNWILEGHDEVSLFAPYGLLDAVPEDHRDEVEFRLGHLREAEEGIRPDDPAAKPRAEYDPESTTLRDRIDAKARELTDAGVSVSASTLWNWRRRMRTHGPYGLVDRRRARLVDPLRNADDRILEVIRSELGDLRNKSTKTLSSVVERVMFRLNGEDVALPSRRTLERYVSAMAGRYSFTEAATRQSNRMPDTAFTPQTATRPGEWVQADSTRLDVMAIMPDGSIQTVDLLLALDVATRSIVSWAFVPGHHSSVDVTTLLADAMSPQEMRPGWEDEIRATHPTSPLAELVDLDKRLKDAAARPVVFPEVFAVDRGKPFASETSRAVCRMLGISLQTARPYQGSDKAIVERTFSSINTLFCQFIPGHKGRNTAHRGDKVESEELLTLEELDDLFSWWVVAVWQRRPHEGLRNPMAPGVLHSPNQMYAAAIRQSGYIPRPLLDDERVRLQPHDSRKIGKNGINFENRRYDSAAIAHLRDLPSGIKAEGDRWMIHYSPRDLRRIWVFDHRVDPSDEKDERPQIIEVPWVHAGQLAQPFNKAVWESARAIATSTLNDKPDEYSILAKLKQMQDGVISVRRAEARKLKMAVAKATSAAKSNGAPPPDEIVNGNVTNVSDTDPDDAHDLPSASLLTDDDDDGIL